MTPLHIVLDQCMIGSGIDLADVEGIADARECPNSTEPGYAEYDLMRDLTSIVRENRFVR